MTDALIADLHRYLQRMDELIAQMREMHDVLDEWIRDQAETR